MSLCLSPTPPVVAAAVAVAVVTTVQARRAVAAHAARTLRPLDITDRIHTDRPQHEVLCSIGFQNRVPLAELALLPWAQRAQPQAPAAGYLSLGVVPAALG